TAGAADDAALSPGGGAATAVCAGQQVGAGGFGGPADVGRAAAVGRLRHLPEGRPVQLQGWHGAAGPTGRPAAAAPEGQARHPLRTLATGLRQGAQVGARTAPRTNRAGSGETASLPPSARFVAFV